MRVVIIPLNDDNYGYLLIDETTNEAAIIDVSGQPDEVLKDVEREKVRVTKILTTHKHWDHAGGNMKMKTFLPDIEIFGSDVDDVEGCTEFVKDGSVIALSNIKITCMLTPGHTMGHISYFAEHDNHKVVFTGDCLFVGGVGKFFEGTAADMHGALFDKLAKLPRETLVYCGHEYTLSNYKFALSVDGQNSDLINANNRAKALRAEGHPTIPSTLEQEFRTNPFMRVHDKFVQASCGEGSSDPVQIMQNVRDMKNRFK